VHVRTGNCRLINERDDSDARQTSHDRIGCHRNVALCLSKNPSVLALSHASQIKGSADASIPFAMPPPAGLRYGTGLLTTSRNSSK